MEAISIESDPRFHFQVGKIKISEGMKCLHDLVEWYKGNLIPENVEIFHETMTYLQSLQQQIQEIIEIREQNAHFRPTLNEAMVTDTNVEDSSCFKRKRWSKVWEDFTKYVDKDRKEWAQCKHCKKKFVGSSKSGTTHLKNHLKSCPSLRNLSGVVDIAREKSVIDQEMNNSDLVRKIIMYGLNGIKNEIIDVYEQEKVKLHKYLDNLSGRFNVTIDWLTNGHEIGFMTVWFIDDNWELKKRIIQLENDDIAITRDLDEKSLKRLFIDWNIDKRILSIVVECIRESKVIELNNWLNERASLPFMGNYCTCGYLLSRFESKVRFEVLNNDIFIKARKLEDYYMTQSNKFMFELAVRKAESMGKKVSSKYHPRDHLQNFYLLDWAMGYKGAFCELEHIDPDFKSINFDWNEATLLHSLWVVLNEVSQIKLANEFFPILLKVLQFTKSEHHYIRHVASCCIEYFDEYCNNSKLVFIISVILDPRFKMDIVQHFLKEMYDNEAADTHLKKIIHSVTNIYKEYAKDVHTMERPFAFSQHANEVALPKSELDCYLTDSKVPPYEDFDILEWWRLNSSTFPTLARMTRDFLSIPIFARSNDFNYSLYEDIKDISKTSLDVHLEHALICTKLWLKDPENI
ncbi:zinc finger BED domain-containing protein RICESLEEPER 2-like [Mangifera indica]|uniref:zinc finger BED domain-containing protein RICESLEEPER 2-like n=1 Tax=Mangifera indica TaxID=29780 RepID=UPI001CF9AA92|nr:zinc finger BED domain-containing protein RICESLEEPER 2-like [Mangifera indica]